MLVRAVARSRTDVTSSNRGGTSPISLHPSSPLSFSIYLSRDLSQSLGLWSISLSLSLYFAACPLPSIGLCTLALLPYCSPSGLVELLVVSRPRHVLASTQFLTNTATTRTPIRRRFIDALSLWVIEIARRICHWKLTFHTDSIDVIGRFISCTIGSLIYLLASWYSKLNKLVEFTNNDSALLLIKIDATLATAFTLTIWQCDIFLVTMKCNKLWLQVSLIRQWYNVFHFF